VVEHHRVRLNPKGVIVELVQNKVDGVVEPPQPRVALDERPHHDSPDLVPFPPHLPDKALHQVERAGGAELLDDLLVHGGAGREVLPRERRVQHPERRLGVRLLAQGGEEPVLVGDGVHPEGRGTVPTPPRLRPQRGWPGMAIARARSRRCRCWRSAGVGG